MATKTSAATSSSVRGVVRLGDPVAAPARPDAGGTGARGPAAAPATAPEWALPVCAGRLTELSGEGAAVQLSLTFSLVRDAQRRGEPAAWVTHAASTFYPPDAAACGIALARLPVVFAPDAPGAARAADKLVRSGAFGLVVLDLVGLEDVARRAPATRDAEPARGPRRGLRSRGRAADIPPALLARLAALAQQHEAAVLFLTDKPPAEPSLGPLVSLRCEARREDAGGGRFVCRANALKDKRRGPGWSFSEVRRGPVGLR